MRTEIELDADVLATLWQGPRDRRTLAILLTEGNRRVIRALRRLKDAGLVIYHGPQQCWRLTDSGLARMVTK